MNKKLVAVLLASIAITSSLQPLLAMPSYRAPLVESKYNKGQIETSLFELKENENYKAYEAAYRITGIKSQNNNAGHYGSSIITKAFDYNTGTHWETDTPNEGDFKNEILVTFEQIEEIDRIIYTVRQDAYGKGFPNQFSIYSSLTEDGNDFELVGIGEMNTTTETVEFKIDATSFKRLKFVFDEAYEGWASCSELAFFKPDPFLNQISNLFADGTYSTLSNIAKADGFLSNLEELMEVHPLKSSYTYEMNLAKTLYADAEALSESYILEASQRGNESKETNEHDIATCSYSLDSYGQYAMPGDEIRVFVDADENGVMPVLVIGQGTEVTNGWNRKEYTLSPGMNIIQVPNDTDIFPGILYIRNPASPQDQAYAPRVRIEGAYSFPVYRHGEMTPLEYKESLALYCEKVENAPEIYPNITELVSENNTLILTAKEALEGIIEMESEGFDVSDTMSEWESMWESFQIYSGFVKGDTNPLHDYYPAKFTSVAMNNWEYAGWSTYSHCVFCLSSKEMVKPVTLTGEDWVYFHEWGHSINNATTEIVEVTNNLYASYMRRIWNINEDRANWKELYRRFSGEEVDMEELFTQLAVINQVEAYFGDDTYGKMCRFVRENKNGLLKDLDNSQQKLVVALSFATGYDLTDFFNDHNYILTTPKMKEKVSSLAKLEVKLEYMYTSAFGYTGNGFTRQARPEIVNVQSSDKGYTLILDIDDENQEALMGYEIYRNGELIAYTVDSIYTDTKADISQNYEYSIVAYDKRLNASDSISKMSFAPTLVVENQITLKVGENFNVLDYAAGLDHKGNRIDSKIQIINSDVNINETGNYSVTFELKTEYGTISKTAKVKVVTDYVYLSDAEHVSATVGWGTFQKDLAPEGTAITLYREGVDAVYSKGLGAHANSKVVYDLTTSELAGYDYFEAYIGIDQAMRNNTNSSAIFEVWVDDACVYKSDLFLWNTEHETLCIPITGASKLTLITNDADTNTFWGDNTDWAMARLTKAESSDNAGNGSETPDIDDEAIGKMPKLVIENQIVLKTGESFNALDYANGLDHDGNPIDGSIKIMSSDVDINTPGNYTVTYGLKTAYGTITKSAAVKVVSDYVYLSDVEQVSATVGWGTFQKDLAPAGGAITLYREGIDAVYSKGLGAHANSKVVYDLTTSELAGYDYFEAYIGIDQFERNNMNSSAIFEVWVDDVCVYKSNLFRWDTEHETLCIPITGASKLTLVTNDADMTTYWGDHTNWAMARLTKAVDSSNDETIENSIVSITMPSLPETVTVAYADGTASEEKVTWGAIDTSQTGTQIVRGTVTVNGQLYEVSMTVVVSENGTIKSI